MVTRHDPVRLVLAATLLLAACQAAPPLKVADSRASKAPQASSPKPSATGAPASPAGGRALASPAAPAALAAAPDTVTLTGTVKLDAGYAVKVGAGRVLANNGATTIAFADASLIANNSGNLVSNNSGNLIANNGGGLLAAWGSGIITGKGAGIISDKGAGIISDKGAGYSLAGFRLGQAAAPAVGEILPAAGMVVGVVDLRTGALLPIGQDAAGAPALAIYTDDRGGYTLHLPRSLATNVVVVAVPPLERVDRRLALDLVTPPSGTAAALDEDTALASRFMREFTVGVVADALHVSGPDMIIIKTGAVNESVKAVLMQFLVAINAEAGAVGLRGGSREEAEKVARRISDVILATVNIPDVMITHESSNYWTQDPAPALPVMVKVLRETREKATETLRRDPAYFEAQTYFQEANKRRAPEPPYRIDKPADIGDFVIREYLLTTRGSANGVDNVFTSLGVGVTDAQGKNSARMEIEAGTLAIGGGILGALLANKDGAYDQALALIRAWKPASPAP